MFKKHIVSIVCPFVALFMPFLYVCLVVISPHFVVLGERLRSNSFDSTTITCLSVTNFLQPSR